MSILRRVERRLQERLRQAFADPGAGGERELLEVYHAVLDEIAGRVQPVGRGKRVFPFLRVEIHIAVKDPAERPAFALAFAEGDRLAADIRDALREAGCEPPAGLAVSVEFEDAGIPRGFRIVYHEKPAAPAPSPAAAPAARLVVIKGRAVAETCAIGPARVNIGRLAEVLDGQERVVRRNQVAFLEGEDPVASTVSRAHAHIQYDRGAAEFRLYDDHSAYGTSLFRGGALIAIPAGAGRGAALRDGDEIYFGQACAVFHVDAPGTVS